MGAVNTTYTFTATDTITSTKMNNIIDETVMTADAVLGGSGGSGGLDIASGKLSISANAINNSRLATNSVTSANIVDGTIVNADINASAAINGTKVLPNFGSQTIQQTGASARIVQYNASSVNVTDFGIGALTGSQDSIGINVGNSTGVLSLGTNSIERMRITAAGNVGVGTSSPNVKLDISDGGYPSAKIKSSYTVTGRTYSSLHFGDQVDNQGGDCGFVYNSATPLSSFFHWTPFGTSQGVPFKITSSGLVGINLTGTPTTALQVGGTVTATAFAGPLTGNVTGNVTGNASTATTLAAARTIAISGDVTGTATSFNGSANISIPVTIDNLAVTTAKIASSAITETQIASNAVTTVKILDSNVTTSKLANLSVTADKIAAADVTAEKLSGAQTGTAPVYGIRAYARVQANGTIDVNKGFSSISRGGTGFYNLTLSTTPTSVPVITATCHTASGVNSNYSAAVQINSSSFFIVKTGFEDVGQLNDVDFSIMVIY